MALKFLDGICVTLTGKLEKAQTSLPVSAASVSSLCSKLPSGDHSYLTLVTPLGSEIVKVVCNSGVIVLTRAQGGTEAVTGAVGKCLCFKINKLILDESGVTAASCVTTIETPDPKYIKITPPEAGKCNWKIELNPDFLERLDKCCPEDECDCAPCVIGDGVYENATVTIKGGKVCGIANGTNIVYTSGSSCGCAT